MAFFFPIFFFIILVLTSNSFKSVRTLWNHIKCNDLMLSASETANDWEIELKSPCKLNLFLRITGRRPNGFHDLASLFQTISLSDTLYFSKLPPSSTTDELICSDKSLTVDSNNLVIKALDLMREKTSVNQYFKVFLDKYVPMQAGLGGGSGNAATGSFPILLLDDFYILL